MYTPEISDGPFQPRYRLSFRDFRGCSSQDRERQKVFVMIVMVFVVIGKGDNPSEILIPKDPITFWEWEHET